MSNEGSGEDQPRRRRRGARAGGASRRAARAQPRLPFPPVELVSRDELESIHQAALRVLERDRRRLHARRGQGDAEGRRRRRRPRLRPRALRSRAGGVADRPRAQEIHAARPQSRAQRRDRRRACRRSARSPRRPTPSIAKAGGGPAIIATSRTSSASGRRSTWCMSGAAIPSSPSTSTPRSAISSRCSTC